MDVLLVEDDPLVRATLSEDLIDAGLDVVSAPSAEAGLHATDRGERPRVLVTDVALGPGMDGLELACEAGRRWPELPIVVITGDPRYLIGMPGNFRERCLVKPFRLPALIAAVNAAMARPAG